MTVPNLRTRLTAAGVLCLCAFLLALVWHRHNVGAGVDSAAPPTLEMGMNVCASRVVFSIPRGSKTKDRYVWLDDMQLKWRALPTDGLAALRTETIDELQSRVLFDDEEGSNPSGPYREEQFNNAWGAFYYSAPSYKGVIRLRAFRPLRDRALVIDGGGVPGAEDSLISSVQQMSSTLREHVAGTLIPENAPYCLDGAVISFPYQSYRELTHFTAILPQGPRLSVKIESNNGKKLQPSLDAVKEQAVAVVAKEGFESTIERNRRLDSRAYEGDELVVHVTTTSERIYKWRYIGELNSATHPLIDVQLTAKLDDVTDDLDHVWAAIVHSIAPVSP